MSRVVKVEPGRLRAGAELLSQACERRPQADVDAGELGSSIARNAFERFGEYWSSPRTLLGDSTDAMTRALRAAADAYERRDAEDASTLQATVHAI
jgi:hypothetical protein